MGKHNQAKPGFKICSRCKVERPATSEYFYNNERTKSGLWWYCKKCCQKENRRRYKEDRENIISRQIIRGRNYALITVHAQRLKPGAPNTLTIQEWFECLDFFGGLDAYSGREMIHPSLDHVIPLAKGGGNEKRNVIPCDGPLNLWKNDNDMEEWYRKEIFFDEDRLAKIKRWMSGEAGCQERQPISLNTAI